MSTLLSRISWYTLTALYVFLIYTMLGIAPGLWAEIDAATGNKADLLLTLMFFMFLVSLVFYITAVKKEKNPLRYLFFVFFVIVFYALLEYARVPAEKIHLAEYGLLGIMLYNALKIDLNRRGRALYVCGTLICLVIGTADEFIQKALPNRVYDPRDILMNCLSGAMVLLLIKINILPAKKEAK